jgi:hypothetical protein
MSGLRKTAWPQQEELKALCGVRAASAGAVKNAVVITGESPLAEAAIGVADDLELAVVAQAESRVVGGNDIVEIPKDAGALVLDIAVIRAGFEDEFFAVGDAVFVVVKVGPVGAVAGEADDDAVAHGQDGAGQEGVINENGALVHDAIAIGVNELYHAADGLHLIGSKLVLHVSAPFADVECSIWIKGKGHRLLHHRLARHTFEMIAPGHLDGLDGVRRRERRESRVRVPALWWAVCGDERC